MRSKPYPLVYISLYLLYVFLILILAEMLLESGLSFDNSFIPSTLYIYIYYIYLVYLLLYLLTMFLFYSSDLLLQ